MRRPKRFGLAGIGLAATLVLLALYLVLRATDSGPPELDAPADVADVEGSADQESGASTLVPLEAATTPSAGSETTRTEAAGTDELRGRVRDEATGEGVADVGVVLTGLRRDEQRAVSAADGSFRLPRPDGLGWRIEVEAPEGWKAVNRRFRIRDVHLEPGHELDVRVVRQAVAPLAGRVFDESTKEPLEDFALEIRGPSVDAEQVTTDADGRFETRGSFPTERTWVELLDHPTRELPMNGHEFGADFEGEVAGRIATLKREEGANEVSIPIAAGPSYRFRIRGSTDANDSDWDAWLFSSTSDRPIVWNGVPATPVRWNPADELFRVRFAGRVKRLVSENGPWVLIVAHNSRFLVGRAEVDRSSGRHPGILEIDVAPSAALAVTVESDRGYTLDYPSISLEVPGSDESLRFTQAGEDGLVQFEHLVPQTLRVRVAANRHETTTREVELVAGQTTPITITLRAIASVGDVSGTLRNQSGRRLGNVWVSMRNVDDPANLLTAEVTRDSATDGSSFRFVEVPPGTYLITVTDSHNFDWEPSTLRVTAPAEGLEFVRRDDLQSLTLGLHLLDAETGEPLTRCDLVWSNQEHFFRTQPIDSGGTFAQAHPAHKDLVFQVSKEGYAAFQGDLTHFAPTPEDNSRRFATIHLERGWAGRFRALSGGEPVAGVELFFDEVRHGSTNGAGILDVRLNSAPETVRVEHAELVHGWGGGVNPETGELSGPGLPTFDVYLVPRD